MQMMIRAMALAALLLAGPARAGNIDPSIGELREQCLSPVPVNRVECMAYVAGVVEMTMETGDITDG